MVVFGVLLFHVQLESKIVDVTTSPPKLLSASCMHFLLSVLQSLSTFILSPAHCEFSRRFLIVLEETQENNFRVTLVKSILADLRRSKLPF